MRVEIVIVSIQVALRGMGYHIREIMTKLNRHHLCINMVLHY